MKRIRELLVLHHSHFDIGYTHPQPVAWELARRYIDDAIELCEATASHEEPARVRWTCEASWPVLHWLESASSARIDTFARLAREGRLSVGAFLYNMTPLNDAAQLAETLEAVPEIRGRCGAAVRSAVNHDVNGLPWPVTQLLLDAGVELLLMGVNPEMGRAPIRYPLAFRWRGSDGRELLVFDGEHYTGFQKIGKLRQGSYDVMVSGIEGYARHLEADGYPYDFAFLTLTHPAKGDNNPPYPPAVEMIRRWNREERLPLIRYATPEDLLERIRRKRPETIPVLTGDWTDFWNFGAASTARETRISRETRARLACWDLLAEARAGSEVPTRERELREQARRCLHLYNEHTWGPLGVDLKFPESDNTEGQIVMKREHAHEARALSSWLVRERLEALAANPRWGRGVRSLLFVNPSSEVRAVSARVPPSWLDGSWPHDAARVHGIDVGREGWEPTTERLVGPVTAPPFGYRIVPLATLAAATAGKPLVVCGEGVLESPSHRLSFDPETGRIRGLLDKRTRWDWVDTESSWGFFGFVRESVDTGRAPARPPLFGRETIFSSTEILGLPPRWKPDWPAVRQGPIRLISVRVESQGFEASLIREWEAPGVEIVRDRITLASYRPAISLEVSLCKQPTPLAEAMYLAFPCHLEPGWRLHFDTGGLPVEWDREQLPAVCRGWVTVDSWVCLHHGELSITLACPDAPLVQVGGFTFGRGAEAAPRGERPLLLGWPINNYWTTNYPARQAGWIRIRYEIVTGGPYDPVAASAVGETALEQVEVHPVLAAAEERAVRLVELEARGVRLVSLRRSRDGRGATVRLANVTEAPQSATLGFGAHAVSAAWRAATSEECREPCMVRDGRMQVELPPRSLRTFRLVY